MPHRIPGRRVSWLCRVEADREGGYHRKHGIDAKYSFRGKTVRVSEYYSLNRTQPTLDFVDVDVEGDTPLFVSPRALRLLPSTWGDECSSLIQNFFTAVLELIRGGQNRDAERLLRTLREPNETHLGLSKGRARGRALGHQSAHNVWSALSESEAAVSGLLVDLEDTALMVEGISVDIVSDMTTNIMRGPLIRYTQEMCEYYGIPLEEAVSSGPLWDPIGLQWFPSQFERLPVALGEKLLLVPKVVVRKHVEYDLNEYYRHYLLEHLREEELNANTELVELLRDGRRRVTKKALIAKYGQGKRTVVRETLNHPEVLNRYRREKETTPSRPLTHEQLADIEDTEEPDWDTLLSDVLRIQPGRAEASDFEKAIEVLMTTLFYPVLANPQKQHKIHRGRKRIDITYTNMATQGFFGWLARHYPAQHVFVECKNYGREVGNPEADQLSGRFSPSRGKFGLLVCRGFEDKNLFVQRCHDTAQDDRGFIIPIDDEDLSEIVELQKGGGDFFALPLLRSRFNQLIM